MSNLVFFLIFTVLTFLILVAGIKLFQKDAIFTIAIGTIIGANIYNVGAFPISIFGLVFGLDSIIYTVFVFCMLLMYIDYGKKSMAILLYTSIFSTIFTAFLAFMGSYSQTGITSAMIWNTVSYLISIVATFLAIWAMIYAFDYLRRKKWNWYLSIFCGLTVASIINSIIYFGLTFLLTGELGSTFGLALAGSYIGKLLATILCVGVFAIHSLWVKNYRNIKNEDTPPKDN